MTYLIEEIWTDRMENRIESAVGYGPIGYFFTLKEAQQFCCSGRMFTSDDCWAIRTPMPQYRYTKLKKLK